ncbi:MAG: YceI family protein [Bacteroidetes bacterium]|nr:YceI family protein [Bacteroidota bacterium]
MKKTFTQWNRAMLTFLLAGFVIQCLAAFTFNWSQDVNSGITYQDNSDLSEAVGKWEIDANNSTIGFKIGNMWVMNVKGTMGGLKGQLVIATNINESIVELSLKPGTINSGIKKRDDHLKGDEFFDVEKYSSITFKGNLISQVDNGYIAKGDLTIKDVTKTVEVPFNYNGMEEKNGTMVAKFSGKVTIDRKDFHLDDFGGMGMDDEAVVSFTIEAKKL